MNTPPQDLIEYINNEILPLHDAFDSAHRQNHAVSVIERALELATHYPVDMAMVYVAAACHDIGLIDGREHHHIASARLIRQNMELRRWFTPEQIETIADAARDHRASGKSEPSTIYGKIVAEADRLIDADLTISRTIEYSMAYYPELDFEGHYKRFESHLQEKYSPTGYIKLWLPESDNARNLAAFRALIDDTKELRRKFEQRYRELKGSLTE